jgi:hypothetical protein
MVQDRVWVIPRNDLEALAICQLLESRGEQVLVTSQPWGATWVGLERGIQERLKELPPRTRVYGVELGGPDSFGATNIDHHTYPGDDRWRPASSLEQVAALMGVQLDRRQELIAANDRGYIPAMLAMGASAAEIAGIREADRRAQGITADMERTAEAEVASAERLPGDRVQVSVARPTAAHLDLLWTSGGEVLLMGREQWQYSGARYRELPAMKFGESNWMGGSGISGYFGIARPSDATRQRIRGWFSEGPKDSPTKR